jgi:hypothetical protein
MIGYEKNIKMYMIIAGWGIFLIFGANQAITIIVDPYPPFGLATTTILITGGFFVLLGIYNSAALVSTNNDLRQSIKKRALESRLLVAIGQAEMENEIQRTVKKLMQQNEPNLETESTEYPADIDEKELKKYIEFVIREVKREK